MKTRGRWFDYDTGTPRRSRAIADVPSGLSAALAVLQAAGVAGSARDRRRRWRASSMRRIHRRAGEVRALPRLLRSANLVSPKPWPRKHPRRLPMQFFTTSNLHRRVRFGRSSGRRDRSGVAAAIVAKLCDLHDARANAWNRPRLSMRSRPKSRWPIPRSGVRLFWLLRVRADAADAPHRISSIAISRRAVARNTEWKQRRRELRKHVRATCVQRFPRAKAPGGSFMALRHASLSPRCFRKIMSVSPAVIDGDGRFQGDVAVGAVCRSSDGEA